MFKKCLTLAVFSALASSSAFAATGTATGVINLTGVVNRDNATIMVKNATGNVDQELTAAGTTIPIPDTTVAFLANPANGGEAAKGDFQIYLSGYTTDTAGTTLADVTITGTSAVATPGTTPFLANNALDNPAQNVGIELEYKGTTAGGSAEPFELGDKLQHTFDNSYTPDQNYTFYFSAGLKVINESLSIAPGRVTSTINVTVNYK